jgi:hypothetical protein
VGGELICNANAWQGFRDPVLFGGLVSSGWGEYGPLDVDHLTVQACSVG